MPEYSDEIGVLARNVAGRLLGGTLGVALVGPQRRTNDIVARLLQDLDHDQLLPVPVQAASATPDLLREAASHAHASRGATDTVLLLIVADAGRLSSDMLRELEDAAEAATSPGGLKILLAGTAPLSLVLRDAGLTHLSDCLGTDLIVEPEAPGPQAQAAQAPIRPLVDRPPQQAKPRRLRFGRFVLLLAILAGLLLAALLVLHANRPAPGPPVPVSTQPAPEAPVPVPSPPSAPIPAPVPAPAPMPEPAPVPAPAPAPALPVSPPPGAPAATPELSIRPGDGTPGQSPLLLVAQPGDTLPLLFARVYAGNTPPPYPQVVALNPVVVPGTRLIFPAPPGGWRSRP